MKEAIKVLKENDIRVTPQRVKVYEMLFGQREHLTAEDVFEKVRETIPAISLATVYTILELFKKKDLVSEIRIVFDRSSFDIKTDTHHHFLCKKCSKIFDIDIRPCRTLEKMEVGGHLIEQFHGYFYGICERCKK